MSSNINTSTTALVDAERLIIQYFMDFREDLSNITCSYGHDIDTVYAYGLPKQKALPITFFGNDFDDEQVLQWLDEFGFLLSKLNETGAYLTDYNDYLSNNNLEINPLRIRVLVNNLIQEIKLNSWYLPDDGRRSSYLKSCLMLHSYLESEKIGILNNWHYLTNNIRKEWDQTYLKLCAQNKEVHPNLAKKEIDERIEDYLDFGLISEIEYTIEREADQLRTAILLLDSSAKPLNLEDKTIKELFDNHIYNLQVNLSLESHSSRDDFTLTNLTNNNSSPEKNIWKNLPPKVLLLYQLGFFKLASVEELSNESKGKLISILCGGSADNAVDYIRECDPQRLAKDKNPYRVQANVKAVNDLLNQLRKDQ